MPSTAEELGICFVMAAVLCVSLLWLQLACRIALKNPVQVIKDSESVSDKSLTLQVPVSQTIVDDSGRKSSDSENNNVAYKVANDVVNKVAMPSQPPSTYLWDELRGPPDNNPCKVIPSAPSEDPHICGSTRAPQALKGATRPHPTCTFAVNVGEDAEFRPWIPTPINDLTMLKKASQESGPNSPYFEQVLKQWAANLQTHFDWVALLKACLSRPQFLQWKASYQEEAETVARNNAAYGIAVTFDMLTSRGTYIYFQEQARIGVVAYFDQVRDLALKALKNINPPDYSQLFRNLVQGPGEWFPDFLARVLEAVEKRLLPGPDQDNLVKQLAWEGATKEAKAAIAPVRNEDISKWIEATKEVNPADTPIQALTAAINKLSTKKSNDPLVCWGCQEIGHLRRNCPNTKRWGKPKTLCPRCKKGFHWAKDCKTKPLNSQWGGPQPSK